MLRVIRDAIDGERIRLACLYVASNCQIKNQVINNSITFE